jgi:RNA polymerase sigma-70 factor (ECF subfamily)
MTATYAADGPRAGGRTAPGDSASLAVLPSFRAVYDDYFEFVWSCTRRLGVPLDAVDDVVQEIFLVVHAKLATVERPASLRSWLYSVVRRTVSTYHRSRRARNGRESAEPGLGESADLIQPSPLDLAMLSDELKLLWRLLGEMDAPKREVFILAELDEMTVPEIAQAIGIPLNTAYSRLRVARQEFNEAYLRYAAQQKTRRSR